MTLILPSLTFTLILDALSIIPGLTGMKNASAIKPLLKDVRFVEAVSSLFKVAATEFRLGRLGRAIGGILNEMVALMKQGARARITVNIGLDLVGLVSAV